MNLLITVFATFRHLVIFQSSALKRKAVWIASPFQHAVSSPKDLHGWFDCIAIICHRRFALAEKSCIAVVAFCDAIAPPVVGHHNIHREKGVGSSGQKSVDTGGSGPSPATPGCVAESPRHGLCGVSQRAIASTFKRLCMLVREAPNDFTEFFLLRCKSTDLG